MQQISFGAEFLFLALALATLLLLLGGGALFLTQRRPAARRLLLVVAAAWAVYVPVLVVVAFFSRQVTVPPGADLCFDEMCFAVADVQIVPRFGVPEDPAKAAGKLYGVTIRVSNHARARAQSETGLRTRLWQDGHFVETSARAQQAYAAQFGSTAPLAERVAASASRFSVQVFEVPASVTHPALVLDHGFTPGYFVIGESPFFHPPAVLLLPEAKESR